MSTYNKVVLIGHLGGDPIIREFESQAKVAELNLATHEIVIKNGSPEEKTDWHEIVAWQKLADFAENFLNKGQKILVEGKLRTRTWEDKETGKKRKSVFVLAEMIRFMDKKESDRDNTPVGVVSEVEGEMEGDYSSEKEDSLLNTSSIESSSEKRSRLKPVKPIADLRHHGDQTKEVKSKILEKVSDPEWVKF